MLSEDFLIRLEFDIGHALSNAEEKYRRRFWCDGVLLPENENDYSKIKVNNTKRIETHAWMVNGENGQSKFKLIIKFGKYANRRYQRGTELIDCIPSIENADWIEIDVEREIVEIQLW